MDDPKKRPLNPPSPEDEEIIDLIDEVPDGESAVSLSDLEKNLIELERRFGAEPVDGSEQETALEAGLPDLGDLEELDFELETETPEPATAQPPPPLDAASITELEQHLDWLFDDEPRPAAAAATEPAPPAPNEVIHIADFEEQFLEAEGGPVEPEAPPPDGLEPEEEALELLDVEEEEPDEELIWFDSPETAAADDEETPDLSVEEMSEALDSPGSEAFAAADEVPETAAPEIFPAAAAAAIAPAVFARPAALPADGPAASPPLDALPPEQIEAAVERVITRLYSTRIETIILQAIQKAVTREIERLKNEVLENDPGDRPI
jgi:hypothetical protein